MFYCIALWHRFIIFYLTFGWILLIVLFMFCSMNKKKIYIINKYKHLVYWYVLFNCLHFVMVLIVNELSAKESATNEKNVFIFDFASFIFLLHVFSVWSVYLIKDWIAFKFEFKYTQVFLFYISKSWRQLIKIQVWIICLVS